MSCKTFLKTAAFVAAIPAAAVIVADSPQPASALSQSITPSYGATAIRESVEIPAPVAPAELISRYASYSFLLTNGRSRSIYYFYVSPNNVSSWEEDVLGSSTLSPGSSIRVNIDDNRQSCIYDFKAVFSDGSSSTHYGIDICDLSSYTF